MYFRVSDILETVGTYSSLIFCLKLVHMIKSDMMYYHIHYNDHNIHPT